MLVYLADTESGGETTFPKARKPPDFDAFESSESTIDASSTARPSTEWSDCAKRSGVPVRSEQGDAVLFWSLTDAYELDPGSLHGACPVLKGEKWTAVKWMRVAKFDGGFPEDAKLPMPSLSVSRRSSGDEVSGDESASESRAAGPEFDFEIPTVDGSSRSSRGV